MNDYPSQDGGVQLVGAMYATGDTLSFHTANRAYPIGASDSDESPIPLPVVDGTILTADSTDPTGMSWQPFTIPIYTEDPENPQLGEIWMIYNPEE